MKATVRPLRTINELNRVYELFVSRGATSGPVFEQISSSWFQNCRRGREVAQRWGRGSEVGEERGLLRKWVEGKLHHF